MPKVTNVSRHLIHAGDVALVPGQPADLPDEMMENAVIKAYMELGEIKPGEVEVKAEVQQDTPPELEETSTDRPRASPGRAGPHKT